MAIQFAITPHTYAFPAKVLAKTGGTHVYNILLDNNQDQGAIVTKGDFVELDLYEEADEPTGVTGVIQMMTSKGTYYIEITDPKNGIILCNEAMINEEYSPLFKNLQNYYNPKGTVVRGIPASIGDIWEYSANVFNGKPVIGKKVTFTSGKWVVAADVTPPQGDGQ